MRFTHLSLRPKSLLVSRRGRPIASILHKVRTATPIRRRNTQLKCGRALCLRKEDANGQVLPCRQAICNRFLRWPIIIRGIKVVIAPRPASVGNGTEPEADGVIDAGRREGVSSCLFRKQVAAVVDDEELGLEFGGGAINGDYGSAVGDVEPNGVCCGGVEGRLSLVVLFEVMKIRIVPRRKAVLRDGATYLWEETRILVTATVIAAACVVVGCPLKTLVAA